MIKPLATLLHLYAIYGMLLFFRLCKLLTSAILEVKELAADFLFVLCKENGEYRSTW